MHSVAGSAAGASAGANRTLEALCEVKESARKLVYARLDGSARVAPPWKYEARSSGGDAMLDAIDELGVILSECDALAAFRNVEREAEQEDGALARAELGARVEALEQALAAQSASVADERVHTLEAALDHERLHRHLALEAVEALQRHSGGAGTDPDATLVLGEGSTDAGCSSADALAALTQLRDAHSAELARVRSAHTTEVEQLHRERSDTLSELITTTEALTLAQTQLQEHAEQARAESEDRDAQRARAAAALAERLGALMLAVEHNASVIHTLQERCAAFDSRLGAALDESHSAAARMRAAEEQAAEAVAAYVQSAAATTDTSRVAAANRRADDAAASAAAMHATVERVQRDLHARGAELQARQAQLAQLEASLGELQTHFQRMGELQARIDTQQQQLAQNETEVQVLREQLRDTQPLRSEVAKLSGEASEMQKLLSMYKSNVAHAERAYEESQARLEQSHARMFALEQELAHGREETEALRESKRKQGEHLRAVRASEKQLAQQLAEHGSSPGMAALQEQHASLQAHVEQLEAQLALRAAEAEESDTRMLEVLKENKRLTAKNRSLQAELQGLRTAAASAAPAGKPEAAPAAAAPKQASPVRRPILQDRTNTPGRKTEPEAANKPEAAARPARPEAPMRPKPESRFMDRLARFKPVG